MKVSCLTNDGRKKILVKEHKYIFLCAAIWQLDIKLRSRGHRDLVYVYLKLILFQKCFGLWFSFAIKITFDLLGYISFCL